MKKVIAGSLLVIILTVFGIFRLIRDEPEGPTGGFAGAANTSIVDGKQVIEIRAKGGYAPRVTAAKANMPTVINVQTNGTFDCSSALTVPAVGFRAMLPSSGTTPIEIPPQPPGTTIKGLCTMGMYTFSINFS